MGDQDSSQDIGEQIISKLQELNGILDKILEGNDGEEKLPDSSSS